MSGIFSDQSKGQTTFECCWCHKPVAQQGDTCDAMCYTSWFVWYWQASEAGIMENVVEYPKSAEDQPWWLSFLKGEG